MARNSAKVSTRGLPGSRGRRASATDNPSGRASQPRGGRVPIRSSGSPSTRAVSSGSSGRALTVGGKQS